MTILRYKQFETPERLVSFVNRNNVSIEGLTESLIETGTGKTKSFHLFFRDGKVSNDIKEYPFN